MKSFVDINGVTILSVIAAPPLVPSVAAGSCYRPPFQLICKLGILLTGVDATGS